MGRIGFKMILQCYTSPLVFEFYNHKFRHTHIGYEISSDIIYVIYDMTHILISYEYPPSSIESVGEASGAINDR